MDVLVGTSTSSSKDKSEQELRFQVSFVSIVSLTIQGSVQGTNLEGADLSRLDLRHINFKYANLRVGQGEKGGPKSFQLFIHLK